MFKSLRTKLVISHSILVIVITLITLAIAGTILSSAQRDVGFIRAQNMLVVFAERIRTSPAPYNTALSLFSYSQGLRDPILLVTSDGNIVQATGQGSDKLGPNVPPISQLQIVPGTEGAHNPIYTATFTSPENQRYYLAYTGVNLSMTSGISSHYLVVAIPAADVDPPWRNLIGIYAALGGMVLLVAIGTAFILAQSITTPLQRISKAADAIAHGDYQQRLDVKGNDEVAHLADSFNRMVEAVERTHRAQRDLVTNMSHDLRTPLTSIDGFSQAILDGEIHSEAEYKQAAAIIHDETQHMQHLINEMIEAAKMESGILNISPHPLDFNTLVSDELNQLNTLALQNGLQFCTLLGNLPGIFGDASKLRQVVRNLLDNAIKYASPNSSIYVKTGTNNPRIAHSIDAQVVFGAQTTRGERVFFSVTNSAEPVSQERLALFFDRFYRGDASRSQVKGSGLGLAIVRDIIIAHGGRVEAVSGSDTFTITIWLPVKGASQAK